MEETRCYFVPGDVVKVNKLKNSPEMYVLKKKELTFKDREDKEKILLGIVCRWFTDSGLLLEAVFNTKDILKI